MSDLPAGRELDALIAERVMGLGFFHVVERDGDRETMRLYHAGVDRYATFEHHGTAHTSTIPHELPTLPYYSTDIAAAWEVVEKLNDGWFDLYTSWMGDGRLDTEGNIPVRLDWFCYFKSINNVVRAPTAPLAICQAALKAVA